MSKTLNTRLDDALVKEVHQLAAKQRISISEIVRRALDAYLKRDPSNEHHAATVYESAKTRALLYQFMELQLGEDKTEHALALAEETAREYVKEKLEENQN